MGEKAETSKRVLAALIDALIGWVVVFIPVIGALIGALYLLFKDAAPYQVMKQDEWKNKSVGKKLMGIEVETTDGSVVDLATSAKRNIPLTIGTFIAIIPVLGWIIGPLVALVLGIIELILVLTDKDGRRIGDRFGETRVVQPADVVSSDAP